MYDDAIRTLALKGVPTAKDGEVGGVGSLEIIREGLPSAPALLSFTEDWKLKPAEVSMVLGLSARHIQRLKPGGRLNPSQSEKTLAVLQLLEEAEDYFGDKETARRWIHQPRLALHQRTPISLMDTMTGVSMVSDLLNQLKLGLTA